MKVLQFLNIIKSDNIILKPEDFEQIIYGNLVIKSINFPKNSALKISFLGCRLLKNDVLKKFKGVKKIYLKEKESRNYVFSFEEILWKNFFKEDLKIVCFLLILTTFMLPVIKILKI